MREEEEEEEEEEPKSCCAACQFRTKLLQIVNSTTSSTFAADWVALTKIHNTPSPCQLQIPASMTGYRMIIENKRFLVPLSNQTAGKRQTLPRCVARMAPRPIFEPDVPAVSHKGCENASSGAQQASSGEQHQHEEQADRGDIAEAPIKTIWQMTKSPSPWLLQNARVRHGDEQPDRAPQHDPSTLCFRKNIFAKS